MHCTLYCTLYAPTVVIVNIFIAVVVVVVVVVVEVVVVVVVMVIVVVVDKRIGTTFTITTTTTRAGCAQSSSLWHLRQDLVIIIVAFAPMMINATFVFNRPPYFDFCRDAMLPRIAVI